jgi:hypothetical protein
MDQLTVGILLADLGLIAVFCILLSGVERTSRAFWRFLLWGVRTGPQTLATQMTSNALFYSGLRSITWGFIFFAIFIGTGIVTDAIDDRVHPHKFFLTVLFVSVLFSAMCLLAGLEHLVRSFLRRKNHVAGGR